MSDQDVWNIVDDKKMFHGGKQDFKMAATAATGCYFFTLDYEEECVADEPRSCYNCRYRRWTNESFRCMKYIANH